MLITLNGGYYVNMAARNTGNAVHFHPWGLAKESGSQDMRNSWSRGEKQKGTFKTIREIMRELGHSSVDVIKKKWCAGNVTWH